MSANQRALSQKRFRSPLPCDCPRSDDGLPHPHGSRSARRAEQSFSTCPTTQACADALAVCSNRKQNRLVEGYGSGDRTFRARQDIFNAGSSCDAIYNLVEGWVCLYHILEDGERQILHFALPGSVLAFNLDPAAAASFSAQALTNAVVNVVPHKMLGKLADDDPTLGIRLASQVSQERNSGFDHMTGIGRRSPRERVAQLLLELFVRSRSQWPSNPTDEMHLPLTQEDIGDATGLTFVHINRVLRDLRRDGILGFRYRRLQILDPDKLIDVADVDPQVAMSWTTRQSCS